MLKTASNPGMPVFGLAVGDPAGVAVGVAVGAGVAVGEAVGPPVGVAVGDPVGVTDGAAVGDPVGDVVGVGVVVPPPPPPPPPPPGVGVGDPPGDVKVTVVVLVKSPISPLIFTSAVTVAVPAVVPAVNVACASLALSGTDGVIVPKPVLKLTAKPATTQYSPSHKVAVIVAVDVPSATIAEGVAERKIAGGVIFGMGGCAPAEELQSAMVTSSAQSILNP
jgi:hypothetical protein